MTDLPPPPSGTPVPPPSGAPVAPEQDASAPPAKQRNVLGIVALAVSAVGFIFACIPGALIVGWILLPIGFILGIVALFLKGKKWAAITAIVVAIVGTIVGVVVFMSVMATAFEESFGSGDTTVTQPSDSDAEPAETAAEEDPAVADGDYAVVIGDSSLTEDYEGNPAIVVNFAFTNNGDDDANFMFATSAQAFQDGVELETAIIMDDTFDSANSLKDVKPGSSIDVQVAYLLDGTSDVTVEVTELISFDDTLLATKTFSVQ